MAGDALIILEGVSKAYPEGDGLRSVFAEVDLTVEPGQLALLVGRSGSGKTTLLNLISGIDLPDAGRVHLCGRDLAKLSERERTLIRRDRVGFVFQFFNLVPTLTVAENLILPVELKTGRLDGARERALELLERVGLADRADVFPDRLSGGEQQRVAVARALAHDPDVLLADEPTGNLDEETAAGVVEWLESLVREAGKTLVLVTHDPALRRIADRVLHVHEGRLVEEQR